MTEIRSKNALPAMGALYVQISFKVFEIQNKSFLKDGNSQFVYDVKRNQKALKSSATYNAIKREFPYRTVTPYDIIIIDYHYTYHLNDYEIVRKDNKVYETYIDTDSHKRKWFIKDKHEIKEAYIGDLNGMPKENYK